MIAIFKDIPIRGRFAFGAQCLENTLAALNTTHTILNELVLPRIWAFTTSTDLSIWDCQVQEVDPIIILDRKLTIKIFDFSTISFDTYVILREVYENISIGIRTMISDVIEIGTGNLYGGTGKSSEITLQSLEKVIDRCKLLEVSLPEVSSFKKAPFSEDHGWGKERPKEYYLSF